MYQITHQITYTYDRPVTLALHTVRMRPRCDVTQKLHQFSLTIEPTPKRLVETVDLDGNAIYYAWFADEAVSSLAIEAISVVETFRDNPFDYLLEPWAVNLPVDYPVSLLDRLQPYLTGQCSRLTGTVDPVAVRLAQEIWETTAGSVVAFLSELSDRIYSSCGYQLRETGDALPPGVTWTQKAGSCRDYAMLFIEVCRAVGLAARFVSGYQEGDVDSNELLWEGQSQRHLHAWTEVFLPGAGWRGYDPTQGLSVANTHIALVTCPTFKNTAPVDGTLKQAGIKSAMQYSLKIDKQS